MGSRAAVGYVSSVGTTRSYRTAKKSHLSEIVINENIKPASGTVRVIDEHGVNHGILPLQKALKLSHHAKLDLVLVSPVKHDDPEQSPVCKIMDSHKYVFEKKKKEHATKKKQKESTSKALAMKEVRIGTSIDHNDILFKLKTAGKFLERGHSVRIVFQFRRSRVMDMEARKKRAYELLVTCNEVLSESGHEMHGQRKATNAGVRTLFVPGSPAKDAVKGQPNKIVFEDEEKSEK